jgi:rhodanese-related sulfurtransferase
MTGGDMARCKPLTTAALLQASLLLAAGSAAADPATTVKGWLAEARQAVPQITSEKLHDLVNSEREFVLLDVRLPRERRKQGNIDPFREVDIARGYLEFRAPDKLPDTDARVIVYCGTGKRSLLAARTLQRMGYTDVTNYAGGTDAWQAAGWELAP